MSSLLGKLSQVRQRTHIYYSVHGNLRQECISASSGGRAVNVDVVSICVSLMARLTVPTAY